MLKNILSQFDTYFSLTLVRQVNLTSEVALLITQVLQPHAPVPIVNTWARFNINTVFPGMYSHYKRKTVVTPSYAESLYRLDSICILRQSPWSCFNIKMPPHHYRYSHYHDRLNLIMGIPVPGKAVYICKGSPGLIPTRNTKHYKATAPVNAWFQVGLPIVFTEWSLGLNSWYLRSVDKSGQTLKTD